MKIAAGHESKHKAAMSKAGDVVVVIPISTGSCSNMLMFNESCQLVQITASYAPSCIHADVCHRKHTGPIVAT